MLVSVILECRQYWPKASNKENGVTSGEVSDLNLIKNPKWDLKMKVSGVQNVFESYSKRFKAVISARGASLDIIKFFILINSKNVSSLGHYSVGYWV